jgi:hypothetical protein
MRSTLILAACLALPLALSAAAPVARPLGTSSEALAKEEAGTPTKSPQHLLEEVADKMADERQNWAFTQHARETASNGEVTERVERYDPSRGPARRWELLKLNGRTPSAEEVERWSKKKNRTRSKAPKTLEDYADLSQARVREETADSVTYDVPLRSSAGGLFPGHKISLALTVNKETKAIERAQAGIAEPFKVALGLARVIDLDLDLEMDDAASAEKPQGTASAVINKLGKRVEYHWSEFTRVTSPRSSASP